MNSGISKSREVAIKIIDLFEDLLSDRNIMLTPDELRDDAENQASIYGEDYYNLEDEITEILDNYVKKERRK